MKITKEDVLVYGQNQLPVSDLYRLFTELVPLASGDGRDMKRRLLEDVSLDDIMPSMVPTLRRATPCSFRTLVEYPVLGFDSEKYVECQRLFRLLPSSDEGAEADEPQGSPEESPDETPLETSQAGPSVCASEVGQPDQEESSETGKPDQEVGNVASKDDVTTMHDASTQADVATTPTCEIGGSCKMSNVVLDIFGIDRGIRSYHNKLRYSPTGELGFSMRELRAANTGEVFYEISHGGDHTFINMNLLWEKSREISRYLERNRERKRKKG